MQITSHTINKFKKPIKVSKLIDKGFKGQLWWYYVYAGFYKNQTFEQHLDWLNKNGAFHKPRTGFIPKHLA